MLKTSAAILLCIALISGCAQLAGVPGTEPFPDATLRKAKSAEHWNVIAGDVALQTAGLKDRPEIQGKPLYVSPSVDNSSFTRGFQAMLISKLVNSGLRVATRQEGAAEVRYEAQVVRHPVRRGDDRPGMLSALAGGILVDRQFTVSNGSRDRAIGTAALLVGADLFFSNAQLHGPTHTEVIITTSLIENNRYLMRKTDVYYVEDAEGAMFDARPQIKAMEVTGR